MHDLQIPPTRDADWWDQVTTQCLMDFAEATSAFVWPEAEAVLCETNWVRENVYPTFPDGWVIDPVHLGAARSKLLKYGFLVAEDALLGGRTVTAFLWGPHLATYGNKTAARKTAMRKRRLYRRFIDWTGRSPLCGGHAESIVDAVLKDLRSAVWQPETARPGRVRVLRGRAVEGMLDAAGFWAADLNDPSVGWTPFAVEVKNVRSVLYPWDNEVWDLLSKLSAFQDVLPVLVGRRLHPMTFRMFKDIGAIGTNLDDQVFSMAIDPKDFARVTGGLSLHNAKQIGVGTILPRLRTFFENTGPRIGSDALSRWEQTAVIATDYVELRNPSLDGQSRRRRFGDFSRDVRAAGLYVRGGWAPSDLGSHERWVDMPDDDPDGIAWDQDW